jgi:hypothetical protein
VVASVFVDIAHAALCIVDACSEGRLGSTESCNPPVWCLTDTHDMLLLLLLLLLLLCGHKQV